MMNSYINKRCDPRNYYKAPIIYARENSSSYSDATMYNFSEGGMYFESDYAIRSGSYIYIRMINFSPDVYVPGAYKAYVAQVRWCRKISDGGRPLYGSGVKYTAKSYIPYRKNMRQCNHLCDLCGGKISPDQTHKTDDPLYLCLDCFKYMGKLIDGKIRESIMKFTIGNVI